MAQKNKKKRHTMKNRDQNDVRVKKPHPDHIKNYYGKIILVDNTWSSPDNGTDTEESNQQGSKTPPFIPSLYDLLKTGKKEAFNHKIKGFTKRIRPHQHDMMLYESVDHFYNGLKRVHKKTQSLIESGYSRNTLSKSFFEYEIQAMAPNDKNRHIYLQRTVLSYAQFCDETNQETDINLIIDCCENIIGIDSTESLPIFHTPQESHNDNTWDNVEKNVRHFVEKFLTENIRSLALYDTKAISERLDKLTKDFQDTKSKVLLHPRLTTHLEHYILRLK